MLQWVIQVIVKSSPAAAGLNVPNGLAAGLLDGGPPAETPAVVAGMAVGGGLAEAVTTFGACSKS